MSTEIKYPIRLDFTFLLESEDGDVMEAHLRGPVGRLPTHEEILEAISKVKFEGEQLGFMLPKTPEKLMSLTASDLLGTGVVVPTPEKKFCYDDSELPAVEHP